jgi:hypothetical protein
VEGLVWLPREIAEDVAGDGHAQESGHGSKHWHNADTVVFEDLEGGRIGFLGLGEGKQFLF